MTQLKIGDIVTVKVSDLLKYTVPTDYIRSFLLGKDTVKCRIVGNEFAPQIYFVELVSTHGATTIYADMICSA